MNILPLDRQTAVVSALIEGNSIRSKPGLSPKTLADPSTVLIIAILLRQNGGRLR
jgi:hypothetical protein